MEAKVKATTENLREITCPLYHKYPNRQDTQPAYIELDCRDGIVIADYSGEIGNAIPNYYRQKMAVRWGIPPETNNSSLRALLADPDFLAECQKIMDGFEAYWEDSNWNGRYSEAANKAIDRADQIIFDIIEPAEVWKVEDWLFSSGCRLCDHWDEQPLEEAVAKLKKCIQPNQMIYGDIEDALIEQAKFEFEKNSDSLTETQARELSARGLI